MRRYYGKYVAGGVVAFALAATLSQSLAAEELDTEIPSAGAAVVIQDYINNNGSDGDIATLLPKEAEKVSKKTTENTDKKKSAEDKLFENIAITKVYGGEDGYVNVRKKPDAESKRVGKIYNNCGAKILEETDNGWYKIESGNCTGYIKSEYFATGNEAKKYALEAGYVFANIDGTGIHVREKATTDSDVVTNVYQNENYVVKKFNKDGTWVKLKIGDGVSGWVSAEFVNISIDMETAMTNAEEKEMIRRQKEEEERQRQAALEAERQRQAEAKAKADAEAAAAAEKARQEEQNNSNDDDDDSYSDNNNTPAPQPEPEPEPEPQSSGSGEGSSVVAYAKQFLGNPYVYGGSSLTNGTDCSGFTMSVYAHFGYSLNRTSYTQVYNGTPVSMSNLQPGDLLFYNYGGGTISHVAIYIGGGQIVHASTEETGIIISGMGSPCAARRIIN